MDHLHHHDHGNMSNSSPQKENHWKLAIAATLHGTLGCGLGEIVGMTTATGFGLGKVLSIVLSVRGV